MLALIITHSTGCAPFAAAAASAVTTTGSAIGPIQGFALVQNLGVEWLGYAIALIRCCGHSRIRSDTLLQQFKQHPTRCIDVSLTIVSGCEQTKALPVSRDEVIAADDSSLEFVRQDPRHLKWEYMPGAVRVFFAAQWVQSNQKAPTNRGG